MAHNRINAKTREEWLELRKHGIGSSEVGAILGVNKWCTPRRLWIEKTAQRDGTWEEPERTEKEIRAMEVGHVLEEYVADKYQEATGNHVLKNTAGDWIEKNDRYEWMQASPDRLYQIGRSRKNIGIVECKTTKYPVDEENLPMPWFCQLQYQLGVMELSHGALAWYVKSNDDFGYREFEFDKDFFEWMVERIDMFWTRNIIGGEEPDASTSDEFNQSHPKSYDGTFLEVNATTMDMLHKASELSRQIDVLTAQKDAIILDVKKECGNFEKMLYNGEVVATFKSNKDSLSFDKEAFKRENPDLYKKYIVTKRGARPFVNKV